MTQPEGVNTLQGLYLRAVEIYFALVHWGYIKLITWLYFILTLLKKYLLPPQSSTPSSPVVPAARYHLPLPSPFRRFAMTAGRRSPLRSSPKNFFFRLIITAVLMLLQLVHVHADAPAPNHAWDFRSCADGQDVTDRIGQNGLLLCYLYFH